MKLSIIIPIYNMEKYLEECIESIFNNKKINYDFEVICINDGSTDSSLEILENYKEKYSVDKLKIISIKNSGVSAARNIGIKEARGEYITFIDSDDWISDDFLESTFTAIDENQDSELYIFNTDFVGKKTINHKEKISDTVFNTENHACAKIFKRDIIEKNDIEFPVHLKLAEDMVFTFKYIFMISKIKYIDKSIYCYRCNREGSTMTTQVSRFYNQIFYACDELYNYSIEKKKFSDFKEELEYLFIKNILIRNTPKIIKSNRNIKVIYKEIKEEILYINKRFPNWQDNKYIKQDADGYCNEKLGKYYREVLVNLKRGKYIQVIWYFCKGKLKGGRLR
ncbi:MAG: glycosyltransferase [Clostridiales bacterium]|nr:glycosyltransferase [Clostridiales bacterium]